MKKLFKLLIFIFILMLGFNVKAKTAVKFEEGGYVDTIYINKVKNGVTHYMRAQFLQKSDDKTIAYCLDPFERFNSNDSYTSSSTYSKISQANLNKIKLAAYYGYGFSTNTAKKWYAITQMVIWKYADPSGTYYFTDSLNGNKITIYDKDMASLEDLIKKHYVEPSFAKKTYTMYLGESKTLTDSNSVFSKYTTSAVNGLTMNRSGNHLTLTGNKTGSYKINLTKSHNRLSKNPIFYLTSGAQNLMTVGNVDDIKTYLNIEVIGGSLKIVKNDEDSKTCKPSGEAKLEDTTYNLYKEDKFIKTLTIDKNCEASIDNLELGDYTLKEVVPGTGYQLDKNIYTFTIDKNHLDIHLNLTNKVIKKKVILTKLYGNKELNDYKVEANIKFGIYDRNNNLVTTIITNKSGQAEINLAYGTYTIKQLTSTKNYEFAKDITVKIDENSMEEINYVLKNNIMTFKMKVYKIDKNTKQAITMNHASFQIKNLTTGKYLFHKVENKTTNIFTTNDEGYFITDINLPAGKYQLIEIKSPNGYKLGESIIFSIGEDSKYILDDEKNKVFELYFENEKEIVKQTKIKVPNTQVYFSNYCWYPIIFNSYLYEKKRYC